jgi:hypothetical protein
MTDIKKFKTLRFGFRLLFFFVAYGIPGYVFIDRYKLYEEVTGYKVGVMGIVGLALLAFNFKKEIWAWVNNWEFSIMKMVLIGTSKVWVFIFAYVLLRLAADQLVELTYIVGWIGATEIVAYLGVKPIVDYYDHHVKREIRIGETVEAIKRTNEVPTTK